MTVEYLFLNPTTDTWLTWDDVDKNKGWNGPGWYFLDEDSWCHGPWRSAKEAAEKEDE